MESRYERNLAVFNALFGDPTSIRSRRKHVGVVRSAEKAEKEEIRGRSLLRISEKYNSSSSTSTATPCTCYWSSPSESAASSPDSERYCNSHLSERPVVTDMSKIPLAGSYNHSLCGSWRSYEADDPDSDMDDDDYDDDNESVASADIGPLYDDDSDSDDDEDDDNDNGTDEEEYEEESDEVDEGLQIQTSLKRAEHDRMQKLKILRAQLHAHPQMLQTQHEIQYSGRKVICRNRAVHHVVVLPSKHQHRHKNKVGRSNHCFNEWFQKRKLDSCGEAVAWKIGRICLEGEIN